jgi:hypothetical protein
MDADRPSEPLPSLPERGEEADEGQRPHENSPQVATVPFTAIPCQNVFIPPAGMPLRNFDRSSGRARSNVCGGDRSIISYVDLDEFWRCHPKKDGEAEGQRPRERPNKFAPTPSTANPRKVSLPPAGGPPREAKVRRYRKVYHDLDLCTD